MVVYLQVLKVKFCVHLQFPTHNAYHSHTVSIDSITLLYIELVKASNSVIFTSAVYSLFT
jgi:hypothetical protein